MHTILNYFREMNYLEESKTVVNAGNFEIKDIFAIIINNLVKIMVVAIVFGLIAFFFTTYFIDTEYKSEGTVLLKVAASSQPANITYNDILLTQQLVDTYGIILKSDSLMELVVKNLDLPITTDNLKKMITVLGVKNTQIINISVQDTNAERAKNIVNQILIDAPQVIRQNFKGANIDPVDLAKTGLPVYPSIPLNTVIALFLGAAIVIVLEVLKEYLDDTIKSEEQIKQMFGIPVLGLLPEIHADKQENTDSGVGKK